MYAYPAGEKPTAPDANPEELIVIVTPGDASYIARVLRRHGTANADYFAKVLEDAAKAATS